MSTANTTPASPEEIFLDGLRAKDYRLNGFPQLPNGAPALYGYDDYVTWLADYLFFSTIKHHPEEDAIIEQLQRLEPATALRLLGGHAGGDAAECEVRPHFRYPENFNVAEGDLFSLRTVNPDDEALGDELDVDESCLRDFVREDFGYHLRYIQERKDFNKLWPRFIKRWSLEDSLEEHGLDEPADAGWRVFLAAVLKKIPDKQQRIALLNIFFDEFADAALG